MDCKEFIEWAFNGIGTMFIGMVVSFFAGYKTGVHCAIKQTQTAGNSANQSQVANANCSASDMERFKENEFTSIEQNQKAGNNAVQKQVGGFQNVRK